MIDGTGGRAIWTANTEGAPEASKDSIDSVGGEMGDSVNALRAGDVAENYPFELSEFPELPAFALPCCRVFLFNSKQTLLSKIPETCCFRALIAGEYTY